MNHLSDPSSAVPPPCPGCIDGSCASSYNNGMCMMMYPVYYDFPPDSMAFFPAGLPPNQADYFAYYGYGGPPGVHQLVPQPGPMSQPQGYYQQHHPRQGQWKNTHRGKRGSWKNRHNEVITSHHPEVAMTPALRSAIKCVKGNSQATMFSIDGLIAQAAIVDEDASRFIQHRIKIGSEEEQLLALEASLASFSLLWKDFRGNLMIRDLLTSGSLNTKRACMEAIRREAPLNLSMHKHGCRVIQTAIKTVDDEDLIKLIAMLEGHVLDLIHDPNGNHVIQRIIEATSDHAKSSKARGDDLSASKLTAKLQFIIDDVVEHAKSLSVHCYGCRVVQRALESCEEDQKNDVLNAVIECKDELIKDQYGNYVLQQAVALGGEDIKGIILGFVLSGGPEALLQLSKNKHSSNLIERLLQFGCAMQRELMIKEFLKDDEKGQCIAVHMTKDDIANYVIKTALACAREDQKKQILNVLSNNRIELSKYRQASYIFTNESPSVVSS